MISLCYLPNLIGVSFQCMQATMVRTTPALDSDSCLQADNSNDQAISKIRKNYATKLEKVLDGQLWAS